MDLSVTADNSTTNFYDELNCDLMENYYLISNSKQIECFMIDKENYIRNLNFFNKDKTFMDKFLDTLVRTKI